MQTGITNPSAQKEAAVFDAGADTWFAPWPFAGALTALLFAFHPGIFLGTQTFFYRDYGVLGYPFIYYHHESFWRGELPFWNPLSNCGAPFLAQWGTMTLYPFSLIYLLLPLPWSLGLFCMLHLVLAGLGMYFLAQRWTGHNFAACVAGLTFVCNGLTLSSLMWPNYTVALGWMPWVVLLVERAWREGGRTLVWAALVSALQMLSGVPEIILLTWSLLALLLAGEWCTKYPQRTAATLRFGILVALVAALCAVQLLPFFELLGHSQRDSAFATAKWAMPGWGWANLIVPLFHYFTTPEGTMFQAGQAFVGSYYPGLSALTLAVLAAGLIRRQRVWLLAGVGLFALVLALGDHGFVYTWLRQLIPVVGLGRYPIKFAYLAMFVIPLLAAFAVQRHFLLSTIERERERTRWMYAGAGVVILAAVILAAGREHPMPYDRWSVTFENTLLRLAFLAGVGGLVGWTAFHADAKTARLACAGTLLLMGLDALTHLPKLNPTADSAIMAAGAMRAHLALKPPPQTGASRVMISPAAEDKLLEMGDADITKPFLVRRLGLWSNLNILDDMPKVNGSSTLQVREQAEVQALLYRSPQTDLPALLDFLAVSHVATTTNSSLWAARHSFLPFVTFGQKPVFADGKATLAALADPAFKPGEVVYLPVESQGMVARTRSTDGKIVSQHLSANRVEAEVNSPDGGLLVIAQTYYPAWQAYVDGQPVPLLRANHAFQAIDVPAGHRQVVLKYEDRCFQMGLLISSATLAGLLVVGWRKKI